MVKENEKARALEAELAALGDDARVIVFANTKRQVGGGGVCFAIRLPWAVEGRSRGEPPSLLLWWCSHCCQSLHMLLPQLGQNGSAARCKAAAAQGDYLAPLPSAPSAHALTADLDLTPLSPPPCPQCDTVAKQLEHMDYRVTMLHGGKSQDQREESIKVGGGWRGGIGRAAPARGVYQGGWVGE